MKTKTRNKVLIGAGGATLLGLGIFLLTRSSSSTTSGANSGSGGSNGGGQGGVVLKAVQDSHAMAPTPSPPPLDQNGNYAQRT